MYGVTDSEPNEHYAVFLEPEEVLLSENETMSSSENVNCYDMWPSHNLERILSDLTNWRIRIHLVVTGDKNHGKSIEQIKYELSLCGLERYLAEDMKDYLEMERADVISNYLKLHPDITNYVIIDKEVNAELEMRFPFHCVFTQSIPRDEDFIRIKRKLFYGTGWEESYMFSHTREIEDGFKKVIFLDIDGVLNKDDLYRKPDDPRIEPEFADNLAEIVSETSAEIILSSSWRYGMKMFAEGSLPSREQEFADAANELLKALTERHLFIAGATPTITTGPDSRPLEIKQWLSKRQSLKSFVILDDDTFWRWNWLSPFVVTTSYRGGEDYHTRYAGLEKRYIGEVVRILNQFDEKSNKD